MADLRAVARDDGDAGDVASRVQERSCAHEDEVSLNTAGLGGPDHRAEMDGHHSEVSYGLSSE